MKLLRILIFGLIIILISKFVYSQGWYIVNITNTQSQATPAPFQQDIAICNGSINIGNNFAYVNNATLFNEIDPNGQNVYFATNNGGTPNIYSWYEGQLNYNGVTCYVWWVNIPNGIPANSNVTIYMYIGNSSNNYYSQYYPYVGTNEQVIGTMQYDNGNYTFVAYGYFNNTFDGWNGFWSSSTASTNYAPQATPNGIEMLNAQQSEGTYILPPNNGNIPLIPLIVEEAWYHGGGSLDADANAISLFGNTNQQIYAGNIGSTGGGGTPASDLSTYVQFEYLNYGSPPNSEVAALKSAVTNQYLNYTSLIVSAGTIYSYILVNSTYAQTGYYYYNSNQVWVPLTLLDTYNINNNGYTYYNLNYNPYQYGTLEIGAGTGYDTSYQYIEWVIARAYPPNGIMPGISIQPAVSVSSVQISPSSSSSVCPGTQTNSTVTVNLNNPNNISTTVTFSCSAPSGITCSFSSSSCTTSGSSCSTTLYVNSSTSLPSGWYPISITNTQNIPTPSPFQQDIAICNGNLPVSSSFAYVNNATLFNQINSNGSNVYFATNAGSSPNIYSWYEGQFTYNGVTCDVWWINLSQGIPANSNVTIYMYIGPNSANYYSQYYPYVGEAPQLSSTYGQYDNGNYVFNYYWNFAGTTLPNNLVCTVLSNPSGASGSCSVNNEVTISNTNGQDFWDSDYMITYLYYNQPISIPAIVEARVISLTGNSGDSGWTKAGILYQNQVTDSSDSNGEVDMEVTDGNGYAFQWQSGTSYIAPSGNYNGGSITYPTILVLVFPNTSYACGFYGSSLGVLSQEGSCVTPTSMTSQGYIGLLVTAHSSSGTSSAVFQYLLVRAYPPNGVMPSISILSSAPTPGSYSVTVTASTPGSSASTTYTYNIGPNISISSQSSSNFQNSYNIYITGCAQNYTLYVNNSPYCYGSYSVFQNINSLCTVSYPGSYSIYAQGCYNGNCVNSSTINLNIPSSGGITVPIIDINILNATSQNINTTISVNGSNQNIQSINVYYNNNNVYSNSNVNTNYYSFNLQLPYSNNGNITVCSALTNGQSNCIIQLLYFDIIKIITYYGIILG
jgi:hypothetical protein